MRAILYMIAVLFLAGCSGKQSFSAFPRSYDMPYVIPPEDAPEEYKLGWEHGCKSGLSAYGNDYYKALYSYTQDVTLVNNKIYFNAWTDSFNYCRAYINRYLGGESFTQVPEDETYAIFSPRNFKLKPYDLRNKKDVHKDWGFSMFSGLNTPGWGEHTMGGFFNETDWLGRSGNDKVDWLGRTPAYQ